jgi:hypothetical protein
MVVSTVIPATTESRLHFFIVPLYRHIAEHTPAFSDAFRLPKPIKNFEQKNLTLSPDHSILARSTSHSPQTTIKK